MSVELLLDAHVVDLATIPELWEGLRRVTFINILKYYMVWERFFLGGGSSEDMEFGASTCMFEFSTLMHIM